MLTFSSLSGRLDFPKVPCSMRAFPWTLGAGRAETWQNETRWLFILSRRSHIPFLFLSGFGAQPETTPGPCPPLTRLRLERSCGRKDGTLTAAPRSLKLSQMSFSFLCSSFFGFHIHFVLSSDGVHPEAAADYTTRSC